MEKEQLLAAKRRPEGIIVVLQDIIATCQVMRQAIRMAGERAKKGLLAAVTSSWMMSTRGPVRVERYGIKP